MYFTQNPSLHEIEKLMKMIPNFRPRGHGIMDNGASSYRRFLDGDDNGIIDIIKISVTG